MKLSTFLLGASLAVRATFAHPFDLPFALDGQDLYDALDKRQSGGVVTTGVSGATKPRQEIRTLQNQKPNQWTLFILAMQQFKATPQTSATSYYQIAGIHGVPNQNFNNVGQCSSCSGADGYCTHDSVLFPAWHRAYLALFEQQLVSTAVSIANAWPASGGGATRAQMQTAAASLRLPYWDWAAIPNGNDLPASITSAQITINTQTGRKTINNPLFRHDFQDPSKLKYSPFIHWQRTYRYPSSNDNSATSNNGAAVSAINNVQGNLQDQVYQLFTTCADYAHFSNDDAGSSSTKCSNSLEGIHNTIHTLSGGAPKGSISGGHMYYLSTAAFDPVFWLHHANVDRLFAMWQTLHPASYGATQVAPHNTWTIAAGSSQNKNSPLAPFSKDASGNFWTTADVQNWASTFHYTYPEFASTDGSKAAITKKVNSLYGPNARTGTAKVRRALNETAPPAYNTTTPMSNSSTPLIANNGSLFQYVANLQSPRYSLGGSYYVYLFCGEPASEDSSTWLFDQNLVAPLGVLAQVDGQTMNANVTVAGSIPLTRTLTDKFNAGELPDLTEASVGSYLKKQLSWRLVAQDGKEIDVGTLPAFQVGVYGSTATQPESDDELPEYSEFVANTECTEGKAGGLQEDGSVNQGGSTGSGSGSGSAPSYGGSQPSASAPSYGGSQPSGSTGGNTVTLTTTICPTELAAKATSTA